jgi:antibiotic biosynthesis monooxygenase (ABM) superfamily enzyme
MIELHIYLKAKPGKQAEIEQSYRADYVPAITVQKGFRGTVLLRPYDPATNQRIGGNAAQFDYEINIAFDTEEQRMAWATGPEHQVCWPKMEALCERIEWEGFDVVA